MSDKRCACASLYLFYGAAAAEYQAPPMPPSPATPSPSAAAIFFRSLYFSPRRLLLAFLDALPAFRNSWPSVSHDQLSCLPRTSAFAGHASCRHAAAFMPAPMYQHQYLMMAFGAQHLCARTDAQISRSLGLPRFSFCHAQRRRTYCLHSISSHAAADDYDDAPEFRHAAPQGRDALLKVVSPADDFAMTSYRHYLRAIITRAANASRPLYWPCCACNAE